MKVRCLVNVFTLSSVSSACTSCMGGVCVGGPGCGWNGTVSQQLPHWEEQEWSASIHLVSVSIDLEFLGP